MLPSKHRRISSRYDTKTFPFPDDFFPEIKLSDEQIQSYEIQVEKLVQNALLEYERHEAKGAYPIYRAPWVPVSTEGSLTAIRKQTSEGLTRSEFRLYGRIQCNYRNFINFHYAETSQEHFECNQFMYGYAVDAVVLKNIHTRSSGKTHEYLGIKWLCLQPSHFGRKRDNCFLEYLTYTKDKLDRDVGVRVTMPLEIEECPDLYRTMKIKRVQPRSVAIVRPVGSSDATQLFIICENDFAGLSVSARNFKKIMRIYNDMSLIVDSKHILKQGMMNKTNWVPNDLRKACTSCQLPFKSAMRRRYHCRLCGDIFCYQCVIDRNVPRNYSPVSKSRVFQVAKTHFCTACMATVSLRNEASQTHSRQVRETSPRNSAGQVNYERSGHKLRKALSDDERRPSWWDDISLHRSESDWSETDSDDASKASLNASGRSIPTSSSRPSRGDNNVERDDTSFVATLDVIDDDVAILDEKHQSPRSRLHKKLSMSDFYPTSRRHSQKQLGRQVDTLEVSEVIDTTDMMTMSELRRQSRPGTTGVVPPTAKHNKRECLHGSRGPSSRLSPEEPTTRFRSSRSISQCLAEQEELLRCMLSVSRVHSSSGVNLKSRSSRPVKMNFAATMPAPRPTVRLYDL